MRSATRWVVSHVRPSLASRRQTTHLQCGGSDLQFGGRQSTPHTLQPWPPISLATPRRTALSPNLQTWCSTASSQRKCCCESQPSAGRSRTASSRGTCLTLSWCAKGAQSLGARRWTGRHTGACIMRATSRAQTRLHSTRPSAACMHRQIGAGYTTFIPMGSGGGEGLEGVRALRALRALRPLRTITRWAGQQAPRCRRLAGAGYPACAECLVRAC